MDNSLQTSPRDPVLVVEDHPEKLEEAARAVLAEGLQVLRARSPKEALDLLTGCHPVLAVVDWDMRKAPDMGTDSREVLQVLEAEHSDTVTLVWAAGLGDLNARSMIQASHSRALLHDKRLGIDSLRTRIRRVVARPYGDLRVEHGHVTHIRCGGTYLHPLGVRLVLNRGGAVRVPRMAREANAAARFQTFLSAHHSPARVEPCGHSLRRLVLLDEPGSTLPCPAPRRQGARRREGELR
jgi:CheY-like chemotaxis protein